MFETIVRTEAYRRPLLFLLLLLYLLRPLLFCCLFFSPCIRSTISLLSHHSFLFLVFVGDHRLKIAEAVLDTVINAKLFVDVLNEYLYFYAQECPKIETKYLTGLVALCNQNISELDQDKEGTAAVVLHFKNTVKFIASKAKSGDKRYSAIDLP